MGRSQTIRVRALTVRTRLCHGDGRDRCPNIAAPSHGRSPRGVRTHIRVDGRIRPLGQAEKDDQGNKKITGLHHLSSNSSVALGASLFSYVFKRPLNKKSVNIRPRKGGKGRRRSTPAGHLVGRFLSPHRYPKGVPREGGRRTENGTSKNTKNKIGRSGRGGRETRV